MNKPELNLYRRATGLLNVWRWMGELPTDSKITHAGPGQMLYGRVNNRETDEREHVSICATGLSKYELSDAIQTAFSRAWRNMAHNDRMRSIYMSNTHTKTLWGS